jgi:hypothetical protein
MLEPLRAIEFVEISPPSLKENETEWLNSQVILAQGKAVKLSAQLNLVLAVKLLRALDSICPQLIWEISDTESLLIFNHSTEEWLWPRGLLLPPQISFRKFKKRTPQLQINFSEIWQQTTGSFSERLLEAVSILTPLLKQIFLINFRASEKEKYFSLLIIHSFFAYEQGSQVGCKWREF